MICYERGTEALREVLRHANSASGAEWKNWRLVSKCAEARAIVYEKRLDRDRVGERLEDVYG